MWLQGELLVLKPYSDTIFTSNHSSYITNIVNEAYTELQKNPPNEVDEVSLLQNLLLKGRHYAFLTTYDMFLAGIDTVNNSIFKFASESY